MKFKINKKLLPMKAHYFLFNAGTAPVVPFMPTYARQLGFSSIVVGTIYTILPVVGLLAKPIFGAIADRFQRQKSIFILFQLLTACAFLCIKFIPPINHSANIDFHCNDGVSDLRHCPQNGTQLDKCIVNDLIRDQTNATIENMTCNLMCSITEPWMSDFICKEWNTNSTNCDKDRTEFALDVQIHMNQIEKIGDCLYFEVRNGSYINENRHPIRCPASTENRYFKTNCEGFCNNDYVMKAITASKIDNSKVSNLYQFWLFFCCLVLSWAGMAVVVSLGDAICFGLLGDNYNLYGNQRLWGSVGWGFVSIFCGFLVDEFSKDQIYKDYSVLFYIMLVLIIFDMIASSGLEHKQNKRSTNIVKDIGILLLSLPVVIFFLWCIAVGLCTALIWNFLFWHLEDLADADGTCGTQTWIKTLQGLIMAIQCFGGELPFFFLSGWILKKIGHIHAMSLVLLGFGVRFLLYSFLTNPWWILPIELLNGVTFGIFYSTMASYASIVAPPGTEATLQGLVGAIFEGVGVSLGSLAGGYLVHEYGGSLTFRIFGFLALGLFLLHVAIQKLVSRYYTESDTGISAHYTRPNDVLQMLDDYEQLPASY